MPLNSTPPIRWPLTLRATILALAALVVVANLAAVGARHEDEQERRDCMREAEESIRRDVQRMMDEDPMMSRGEVEDALGRR